MAQQNLYIQFSRHFLLLSEYFWGTKCYPICTKFELEVVPIWSNCCIKSQVNIKKISMEKVVKNSRFCNFGQKKNFLEIHHGCKNAPNDPRFFEKFSF